MKIRTNKSFFVIFGHTVVGDRNFGRKWRSFDIGDIFLCWFSILPDANVKREDVGDEKGQHLKDVANIFRHQHPSQTGCSRHFQLSCTSTDQAQICNDACFAGLGKCIEIECENNVDDHACIKDCSEAMIECDLKCPCEIDGECELGCPCPSYQCEPVCDEVDDVDPSQVQIL